MEVHTDNKAVTVWKIFQNAINQLVYHHMCVMTKEGEIKMSLSLWLWIKVATMAALSGESE